MHSCQMHLQCKLGDCRSVTCKDNAHISFLSDDIKTQHSRSWWPSFWYAARVIIRCMQARLQVSTCSGYDLCHPSWPKLDFYILTSVPSRSRSNEGRIHQLAHPCQMHLRCKFGDHRSIICRGDAHVSFFLWWLKTQQSTHRSGRPGFWSLIRVH